MSQSILLQLARQSIQEVLDAERIIDKASLIQEHPVLNEPLAVAVTLYLGKKVRSHFCVLDAERSLIEAIIYNAKVAAFELPQYPPLTTSEYLHVSIELSLLTPLEAVNFDSLETLYGAFRPHIDGIVIKHHDQSAYFMPENWNETETIDTIILRLHEALHVSPEPQNDTITFYRFQTQKAQDDPILSA